MEGMVVLLLSLLIVIGYKKFLFFEWSRAMGRKSDEEFPSDSSDRKYG
jgi:hypothetical protein